METRRHIPFGRKMRHRMNELGGANVNYRHMARLYFPDVPPTTVYRWISGYCIPTGKKGGHETYDGPYTTAVAIFLGYAQDELDEAGIESFRDYLRSDEHRSSEEDITQDEFTRDMKRRTLKRKKHLVRRNQKYTKHIQRLTEKLREKENE